MSESERLGRAALVRPDRSGVYIDVVMWTGVGMALLILNRWPFTDLGIRSFGRVWQYFVSWGDFGFYRRGLLGTILTETGINRIFSNEYVFAYIFYSAVLVALALAIRCCLRQSTAAMPLWSVAFIVLWSPALLSHLAYSCGNNDALLLLLALLIAFFVRSRVVSMLLAVAGVLIHEMFIFFVPSVIVIRHLSTSENGLQIRPCRDDVLLLVAAVVAICFVSTAGRLDVSREVFERTMALRMPLAANQHPLWSGYFEIASTFRDNHDLVARHWRAVYTNALGNTLIFGYLTWVISLVLRGMGGGQVRSYVAASTVILPLGISLLATDYPRWVCISACLGLFMVVALARTGRLQTARTDAVVAAVWCFFTPFGTISERPLPVHQSIFERVHLFRADTVVLRSVLTPGGFSS